MHDQISRNRTPGSLTRRAWIGGVCGMAASVIIGPSVRAKAKPRLVVPAASTQLIVGIVDGWNHRDVVLHRFTRKGGNAGKASASWKAVGASWEGRLGSNGVAWGRGLHPHDPIPQGANDKTEGDRRAPAGVFRLGTVFGYEADVAHPPATTYIQVTDHDLLVEDPSSPLYNTYVRLDHPANSAWEIANRMTLGDPAHELKVFVHHNTDPSAVPGKGSAILLHISRPSERSYTFGCTAMAREKMYEIVAWLDAARNPLYVLLPQAEYNRVAVAWGLPTELIRAQQTTTSVLPIPVGPASTALRNIPPTIPPTISATMPPTIPLATAAKHSTRQPTTRKP